MKFETVLNALERAKQDVEIVGEGIVSLMSYCLGVRADANGMYAALRRIEAWEVHRERQRDRFRAWLLAHNAELEAEIRRLTAGGKEE